MTSTSIYNINSDKHLPVHKKLLYFVANRINNSLPEKAIDPRLEIIPFQPDHEQCWSNRIHLQSSPSRYLSDLFWGQLDWQKMHYKLGEIRILDIGCGAGGYLPKLLSFSQNHISAYHGIDIQSNPRWGSLEKQYNSGMFSVFDGNDISTALAKRPNCIISQSVLEHIENDMTLFKTLANYTTESNYPVMHIHLIPSAICLKLYLLHGIRQYTPRTISKLTRLFNLKGRENRFRLYLLGGKRCNSLHWRFITLPLLILRQQDKRDEKSYPRLLKNAVFEEKADRKQPCFYALVIT